MFKKIVIGGENYMTRYTIFKCRWFEVYYHIIRQSDPLGPYNILHDHPSASIGMALFGKMDEITYHNGKHHTKRLRLFTPYYRSKTFKHTLMMPGMMAGSGENRVYRSIFVFFGKAEDDFNFYYRDKVLEKDKKGGLIAKKDSVYQCTDESKLKKWCTEIDKSRI